MANKAATRKAAQEKSEAIKIAAAKAAADKAAAEAEGAKAVSIAAAQAAKRAADKAVAAKTVFGSSFTLTRHRGELLRSELAPIVTVTIHPAAILRAPDQDARVRERARFTDDLRVAVRALADAGR